MEEKKVQPKRLSLSNTKQEMMEAYQGLLKQLEEKKETELKPEKKLEEKRAKEVVTVAESLSSEGVVQEISGLKIEISKMLTQIGDKLDVEVDKFKAIQKAIELKEKELHELYEIEKSAMTLAALIETQNQKRQLFETEMAECKEELNQETQTQRLEWGKKKKNMKLRSKNATVLRKRGETGRKRNTNMPSKSDSRC